MLEMAVDPPPAIDRHAVIGDGLLGTCDANVKTSFASWMDLS